MVTYTQAATDGRTARPPRIPPIDFTRFVDVGIRDIGDIGSIRFVIRFYGLSREDLLVVPGGGEPVRIALARRGLLAGYSSSIWDVR